MLVTSACSDRTVPTNPERMPAGVAGIAERAGFYPYLSGRRNLSVLARLDARQATPRMIRSRHRPCGARGTRGSPGRGLFRRDAPAAWVGFSAVALPRLLLLDEPTSALDPAGAREVRALARKLAEDGVAVLWSSHDMVEVERSAPR